MQLEFDPEAPVREVRLTLTVDELEIFWGGLCVRPWRLSTNTSSKRVLGLIHRKSDDCRLS